MVGAGRKLSRKVLVVVEVAVSVVLIIGAGLLIKSFYTLSSIDPGYATRSILVGQISLSNTNYSELSDASSFYDRLIRKLETLPGVEAVGAVNQLPLGGPGSDTSFEIVGRPTERAEDRRFAYYRVTNPDYFETMSIPLLKGRLFTDLDTANSPPVVLISETLARRDWPDQNPIGESILIDLGEPVQAEVIGIVGSVRHASLGLPPWVTMYLPYQQSPWTFMNVVLKTEPDPETLIGPLRAAVSELDKEEPVEIRTMHSLLSQSLARPRFNLVALGVLATLSLFLALVGLYGVIAYSVKQRTREIGVRMAIGAQKSSILSMILREGMGLTLLGLAIGLVAALGLGKVIESLLFEVSNTDMTTFVLSSICLLIVALLASYGPARRAAKTDPLVAMRYE